MRETALRKGAKVWCWWLSRFLWYTGKIINGEYKFVDICDAITLIDRSRLSELEAR